MKEKAAAKSFEETNRKGLQFATHAAVGIMAFSNPSADPTPTSNTTSTPCFRFRRAACSLCIGLAILCLGGFSVFFSLLGGTVAFLVTLAVVVAVLAVFFCIVRKNRQRKQGRDLENTDTGLNLSATPPGINSTDEHVPTQPMLSRRLAGFFGRIIAASSGNLLEGSAHFGPRYYSYKELSIATNNFSQSELLGAGGFGSVYRGMLAEDNAYVAVKCIAENSSQGAKEYKAEVTIINDLRHRNLVRLRGWCHDEGKFLLVYDYMPNGSLDRLLFDNSLCTLLSWERRNSIAVGLGLALLYLHEECENIILHRDIKSSNLLLDEKFNAKLGDFGLSRQVEHSITSYTTTLAGTRGYMAPEFFFGSGKATRETDVFAFGAVLLELVCGKRVLDWSLAENEGMLVHWVWELHSQGRVMEGVDRRLEGRYEEDEARRMLLVGLMCSNPDPTARPRMRRALEVLSGSVALPAVPPYKPALLFGPSLSFDQNSHATTSTSSSIT